MDIPTIVIGSMFLSFCVWLVVMSIRCAKEDFEVERDRMHRILNEMPRKEADAWLRHHPKGPRCACGLYNIKYTDTVKTNSGDHQAWRCQPALERIENKTN